METAFGSIEEALRHYYVFVITLLAFPVIEFSQQGLEQVCVKCTILGTECSEETQNALFFPLNHATLVDPGLV